MRIIGGSRVGQQGAAADCEPVLYSASSPNKQNSARVSPSSVSKLARSFLTFPTASLLHFEDHSEQPVVIYRQC